MATDFTDFVKAVFQDSRIRNVTQTRSFEVSSVDSTAISEVSYNKASSIMRVTFVNGAAYNYFGVDDIQYRSLVEASSVGRTFVEEVRNDYIYFRVG